ncbi:hypothetical protein RvY_08332-1 [Ramazzottius varieornatus]|uniref:Reverse transcriptase domain-containing protein n=1 Tax=Ramazzottius varieornatus TaxID=947166 RepID=A0A1D1VEN7_RAMVA|nr:hypothetical protein RvY_08332-1 [Ramazzottius varieornatus]
MEEQVRPEHVDCGTRGGAEAGVHAVRCFLEEGRDESQVLLKLDSKNAFSTIHREVLLRVIRDSLPKYFPFAWQSYRYPSKLLFGQRTLESARGVQQGDPLGPLLFCVLIQKLTSPLNVWYLNDGTIGGKIETVLSDLQVVISEGWKLGLELNSAKCELFCFGGSALERQAAQGRAAVACPAIFFPSKSDLNLLGAPLMEESLEEAVRAKTSKIRLVNANLNLLFAHQALFLLKNCLRLPKLLYILRCSPL